MWEEPVISGTNGSGAIFFSGCNLRCIYCQNYNISHNYTGRDYSPRELADLFKKLEDSKVHNINLVTATHYMNKVLDALDIYKPSVPIVYNTGGYEDPKLIRRLKGYVDIYLPDLKYSDNSLALKLSGAKDYFEIATNAIKEMYRNEPNDIIENGLMKKGVIIRHLIIPCEIKNSLGVAEWINSNIPHNKYISVMSQFTPHGEIEGDSKYNRKLKPLEYKLIVSKFMDYDNAYVQDMTSSTEEFIPDFENKEEEL